MSLLKQFMQRSVLIVFTRLISFVDGLNEMEQKVDLWRSLENIALNIDAPWLVNPEVQSGRN